jgi:hypothetical protein
MHLDPTTPAGVLDAAFHAAPILAPFITLASLMLAKLTGGK